MTEITNDELIAKAKSVVKARKINHGCSVGDNGCALLTDKNNVYLGVSIDVSSGMGFCAEHSAIASMITAGEHKIKKIVAISRGKIRPPCGRCREFMHQMHEDNLKADVLLGKKKSVKLKELLPFLWD